MDPTVLTAAFVFLTVTLGTISLVLLLEWGRERVRARRVVRELREMVDAPAAGPDALLRAPGGGMPPWLEVLAGRVPSLRDLSGLLERGETRWSLATFFLLTLGAAAAAGAAAYGFSRSVVTTLAAAAIAGSLPYGIARRRARLRMARFEEQLPDAIDLIGRAIRAGHPLSAGLKMVAEEAPDPAAVEFNRVFEEQRFGLPFDESMYGMADRVPLTDTRILVTAVLVQREVGGNLAEILDNLAHVIRERFKLRRQLRVITAQGRLSGAILAVLPIAVGLAIFLLNRPYIMVLFEHPVGRAFLAGAVVLQILGYLWIRRIVDIEF